MLNFLKRLFAPEVNYRQLMQEGAVIVDVRSVEEFKLAHMKGAENIPLETISSRIDDIKKFGKPVLTVCRSGIRSNAAKNILTNNGIKAYNAGGWVDLQKKMFG